jgi:cytochrome c-type biogenesis protein CcmE
MMRSHVSFRPSRLLVHSGVVLVIMAVAAVLVVRGSFRRANRVETPSALLRDKGVWGGRIRLTGVVGARSLEPQADGVRFAVSDRDGARRVIVRYEGDLPDQLDAGQAVEVTGSFDGRVFEAQPSTLIVICGRAESGRHC